MSTACGKDEIPDGLVCLCGLIGIFNKYASADKDTTHLSKSELKSLLETEFPVLINKSSKPEEVKKTLDALDFDGDGQVDIHEYFATLCCLGTMLASMNPKKDCSKKC